MHFGFAAEVLAGLVIPSIINTFALHEQIHRPIARHQRWRKKHDQNGGLKNRV